MSDFKRVMVVDDDSDIAELLRVKITQLNYEVQVHHSAKGTVDAAKQFRPDLILLDVMLGDGIGYQVARTIRKDPLLYTTPLLFQSVLDEQRDIAHAYSEGGDGYLTKPYSLEHLVESVEQMRRLYSSTHARCPVTGLRSMALLRREIDHRLFRGDSFALFYFAMEGITALHKKIDHDEITHIAQSIGVTVRETISDHQFFETVPCHLGGGYFMALTTLDDRARFRRCLADAFTTTTTVDARGDSIRSNGSKRYIPGKLLVAYTHTQRQTYLHATQMIEDLKRSESDWKVRPLVKSNDAGHASWLE